MQTKDISSPKGLPIVCYDTEIKACIGEGDPPITWNDHHRMGISVAVSFDYRTGDFSIYYDDDIAGLVELLNNAKLVVGFNQIGFDNKLLRAMGYPLKPDSDLNQYDMLLESRLSLQHLGVGGYPKGLKLDDHLEGMFGKSLMKTGNGEMAPILYQNGRIGVLTSYCVADVRRHCMVFDHIWEYGWVKTPIHGVKVVRSPRFSL